MEDSVFTRIIRGEIPCHKIYEDDLTYAFLDIHPVQDGHVLVTTKNQVVTVWDLPAEDYLALMNTGQKVANRLREIFPEKMHIGMIVEGLDIPHAHLNIFPFDDDTEFRFHPDSDVLPDHDKLAELAKKIAF